jgi:hypothetical protein
LKIHRMVIKPGAGAEERNLAIADIFWAVDKELK